MYKRQYEIILSGVGGQGMILCGTLLAQAAIECDDKVATLSSEYGVETRGTFAKSDLIVSDHDIGYPYVTDPDIILCLAQVAYDKYSRKTDHSILIYDSDNVAAYAGCKSEFGVPMSHIAEEIGSPASKNILTMGIVVGILDFLSYDGSMNAVKRFFKNKGSTIIDMNLRALSCGYNIGNSLKGLVPKN